MTEGATVSIHPMGLVPDPQGRMPANPHLEDCMQEEYIWIKSFYWHREQTEPGHSMVVVVVLVVSGQSAT